MDLVTRDLKEGVRLGVKEEFKVSSVSNNAASSMEYGEQVTDALVGWLHEGFAIGPFDTEEVPFEKTRISGVMCKIKPTGSARVIINMSKGKPFSVNEGIDKTDFPTAMSSTRAWIRIMIRCGRNCKFMKSDWISAYKQIRGCSSIL